MRVETPDGTRLLRTTPDVVCGTRTHPLRCCACGAKFAAEERPQAIACAKSDHRAKWGAAVVEDAA